MNLTLAASDTAAHRSVDDRVELGRKARAQIPRSAHAEAIGDGRRDPVEILAAQDVGRVADLLPLRYARMAVSPFTFFRGAAAVMAADLAGTPVSDLPVQSDRKEGCEASTGQHCGVSATGAYPAAAPGPGQK